MDSLREKTWLPDCPLRDAMASKYTLCSNAGSVTTLFSLPLSQGVCVGASGDGLQKEAEKH